MYFLYKQFCIFKINFSILAKKALKNKVLTEKKEEIINIDETIGKYFWIIIPVLAVIYFISSKISQGFYQDDEIGQFLNMLDFWTKPFSILGNNPKPGWKIFMVLPALFGYDFVLFFNSLIAAATVFFAYKLLRIYKVNFAYLGALLLASQPLFFDLSFRSYSEIFTALCIVIFLILYKKEKFLLIGLMAGYIFTIRQEMVIFLIILFIIFIINKKYVPALLIGIFPVLYNILGYFKTGDIMFILTEMKSVASLVYTSQGPMHYFIFYIFIVGPVCLSLFLSGFFGFLTDTKKNKEYIQKYLLFYAIFITVFAVQVYIMFSNGPNPGNWRYLLHISPVCVFFAMLGFNNFSNSKTKTLNIAVLILLILITFAFFSKVSDGFKFKEPIEVDYTKVLVLIAFLFSVFIFPYKNISKYLNTLSVFLVLLSFLYLGLDFKPKVLSQENLTVINASKFINTPDFNTKTIFVNHTLFKFYSDNYRSNPLRFKTLNSKNLKDIEPGSILVWESHYGYRPDFKNEKGDSNDVKFELLQKDTINYKLLNQFISADKRFSAFIFQKN
jgi:hypothetical protein